MSLVLSFSILDHQIQWPESIQQKQNLAELVHRREPNVVEVIGFTDGLSLPVQCTSDPISQVTNYNGHHRDTMVNNVFRFAPTGKVIFACINFPGSWHDAQASSSLITKLAHNIGEFKICVHQGFLQS